MKKILLQVMALLCLLCSCDDKDSSNFSKVLTGEWKIRTYGYGGYGLSGADTPPCAWKRSDGIYFKFSDSRIFFNNDGTYSITLDSLCKAPGFSWDTVAYKRNYSVSGDRITGMCGDYIWGKVKKRLNLEDEHGNIIRDSIYKTGSVAIDSITVNHFKDLAGNIYGNNEFTTNEDLSIITDRFARDDTSSVRPWILIRIVRVK